MDRPAVRPAGDPGYATAEAAMALPALLAVLALAVGAVTCVGAQLRCVDAARAAARVAARGDSDALAGRAGLEVAPRGSRVRVTRHGDLVAVEVTTDVHLFRLPGVPVRARAAAEVEGP